MSYVYVIQAGEIGPVKIGMARDPQARLEALQTASPVALRLLVADDAIERTRARAVERRLHESLRASWIRGEWFRFDAAIRLLLSHHYYGMSLMEFARLE